MHHYFMLPNRNREALFLADFQRAKRAWILSECKLNNLSDNNAQMVFHQDHLETFSLFRVTLLKLLKDKVAANSVTRGGKKCLICILEDV